MSYDINNNKLQLPFIQSEDLSNSPAHFPRPVMIPPTPAKKKVKRFSKDHEVVIERTHNEGLKTIDSFRLAPPPTPGKKKAVKHTGLYCMEQKTVQTPKIVASTKPIKSRKYQNNFENLPPRKKTDHEIVASFNQLDASVKGSFTLVYRGPDIKSFDEKVIIGQNEELRLSLLASGSMHHVWKIDDKDHLIIKTLFRRPKESIEKNLKYYDSVHSRQDLVVATLHNRHSVLEDGFYIYDFYPENVTDFSQVEEFFLKMFKDPNLFIPDFGPDNVKVNSSKQIVLIDLDYIEDIDNKVADLVRVLKKWHSSHDEITKLIHHFESLKDQFSPEGKNLWDLVVQGLQYEPENSPIKSKLPLPNFSSQETSSMDIDFTQESHLPQPNFTRPVPNFNW